MSLFQGSSLWSPNFLGSTLIGWFDADDSRTITEAAGLVSQWDDKSGNGANATQGAGGDQPLTGSVTLNSKNLISFNEDFLSVNVPSIKAVFFIADNANGSDFNTVITSVIGGATANQNYTFIQVNVSDVSYDISIDGNSINTGNANVNGGSLVNGTNIDLGQTDAENKGPNLWYVDYDTAFTVGHLVRLDAGATADGIVDVGEFIFLDAVPSTVTRQIIEGYLAHKWGLEGQLPGGHPYKNQAPTV